MNVNVENNRIYSEINSVLNIMPAEYKEKLPKELVNLIENTRDKDYNPEYTNDKLLKEQNISKEALSMIALFHLNYWCDSDEEKTELIDIFAKNQERYEEAKANINVIEDIFKDKNLNTESKALIKLDEDNFSHKAGVIANFFRKIRNLFTKKEQAKQVY